MNKKILSDGLFKTAIDIFIGEQKYLPKSFLGSGPSARCVELPWTAYQLRKQSPRKVLDIGISLADLDYLKFLLYLKKKYLITLHGIDIIDPVRVRTRYPEDLWNELISVPLTIGDVRYNPPPSTGYDLITCISVIEHIGYDKASPKENNITSFTRATIVEDVDTYRPIETDQSVLDKIAKVLRPGGALLLTVPAGKGGPVILKDTLGFYCAQYEYDESGWNRLTSHSDFTLEESVFFKLKSNGKWTVVDSIHSLQQIKATDLKHSNGCAAALLCKKERAHEKNNKRNLL